MENTVGTPSDLMPPDMVVKRKKLGKANVMLMVERVTCLTVLLRNTDRLS
ncbi:hypothetical protein [Brucella pseudogrignonensis]|uniref:Uncharacterized protein n=1 Tax=Brucella pseudogrignonensis TaxID=419475 RepID=A0ABU1MBE7_9HYPH|nr:hypothetical protein [Brucella pseudogrignonensis]